jgi:hypothetical protein
MCELWSQVEGGQEVSGQQLCAQAWDRGVGNAARSTGRAQVGGSQAGDVARLAPIYQGLWTPLWSAVNYLTFS